MIQIPEQPDARLIIAVSGKSSPHLLAPSSFWGDSRIVENKVFLQMVVLHPKMVLFFMCKVTRELLEIKK